MRRPGFTLIELLVIIGIMATMVTVGVVGLNSSRASTRLFGAGRDVMAMIRRARSMALVTQKSVVIEYGNETVDDEPCLKVTIEAEKLFAKSKSRAAVYNLAGDLVVEAISDDAAEGEGETLEDILAPETLPVDVARGLKIKALDESDTLNLPENETRRSKISIFSTADNVSRTLNNASSAETSGNGAEKGVAPAEGGETLSVAFAANGTVNPPHRVWIYREGMDPSKGICIRVDRFGEPQCEDFE